MQIRVVAAHRPPHVFLSNGTNGQTLFVGYLVDLLSSIFLKARPDDQLLFYPAPENVGGSLQPNGSWNGVIGEVISGRANVAAFPTTLLASRMGYVDLTYSYFSAGLGVAVKKQPQRVNNWFFWKPLDPYLWMLVAAAICAVGTSMWVMIKIAKCYKRQKLAKQEEPGVLKKKKKKVTSHHVGTVYLSWLSMLSHFEPPDHNSWALRIFLIGYLFFCLIVISVYTANLAAFLTVSNLQDNIKSLDDIMVNRVKFGINKGGNTENYLRNNQDPSIRGLASSMTVYTEYEDGITALRKGEIQAFVGAWASIQYLANQAPCNIHLVGQPFGPGELVFAVEKGSNITNTINFGMLKMTETGELQTLRNKWFQAECGNSGQASSSAQNSVLSISDFSGLFIMLGCWCALGILMSLFELYLRRNVITKTRVKTATERLSRMMERSMSLKSLSLWRSNSQRSASNDLPVVDKDVIAVQDPSLQCRAVVEDGRVKAQQRNELEISVK